MSVRQLADWGAVKRIWVKGDRRDFYRVEDNLGQVVTSFLDNMLNPRIESSGRQFAEMEQKLKENEGPDSLEAFYQRRIGKLTKIHQRISKVFPLLKGVLK